MAKVLWFSDPHCPAMHEDYPDFLAELKCKEKPDIIICGGDELDFHTLSVHPKETIADGTITEFDKGIKQLKTLYKIFPVVKSCISNHTLRPYRMAASVGVPDRFMLGISKLLEAPIGWKWDSSWIVDKTEYMHGDNEVTSNMLQSLLKKGMNVVYGHYHSLAGIVFAVNTLDRRFAVCSGCGADRKHYMMKYGQKTPNKPFIGAAIIEDGIYPRVIPMKM